jgi:hypothetical protein
MSELLRYKHNSNMFETVTDLIKDVDKCKAWLATHDGHTNIAKIRNVLLHAAYAGRSDVYQLILDSGRLDNAAVMSIGADAIANASYSGKLSMVKFIVSRCHPSTQYLYRALTNACACGHVEIVTWVFERDEIFTQ